MSTSTNAPKPKKRLLRRIMIVLGTLLLAAQLIQPDRSAPAIDPKRDMLAMSNAPQDIAQLVRGACYDCHSDRTEYPWYSYITPVNFWLQDHVNEGREELNFSQWDAFSCSEAAGEAGEEVEKGKMPLESYTWVHSDARLSAPQREQLVSWLNARIWGDGGEGERKRRREKDEER